MSWKDRFDLRDTVYLNGATQGPLPRVAIEAVGRAVEWKRDPSAIDDAMYFELPERVRRAAAPLFGCRPQDLAVCTGASSGVGLLAGGLDWQPGDRVVIPAGEFPANYLPWKALQARGVSIDVLPAGGGVRSGDVAAALQPSTRVVAIGHVNFATGYRADLGAIGALCRERGIAFLIDASQSAGAMPLDAPACHATVATAAGYKWLLSPYGTGLFYVDPEWVDRLPVPVVNWTSVVGAEDFNNLTTLQLDYRPGAVRWDVPETASFFNLLPMAASLELLEEIGVEAVLEHSLGLIDRLVAGLPPGYRADSSLATAERSSIFRIVSDDPARTRAAHRRCAAAGIALGLRENGIRVSPGVWSCADDIDRLIEELAGGFG